MKICKHCLLAFDISDKPRGWMANHSRWCEKNPKRKEYEENLCKISKESIERRNCSVKNAWNEGKYDNADFGKSFKGKKHTEESKNKISEGLKKAHQDNRHPGWLNSNRKNKSYPEKLFLDVSSKLGLFEKYDIIDQFPFHRYFFDFAIIDCKVDVEIDGSQHYRTNEAIKYDKLRDEFTNSKGWKVYRISAKELKLDPIKEISMLIEFLDSKLTHRVYSREDLKEFFNKKYKRLHGTTKDYMEAKKKSWENKNKKYIEQILNSNIDFSKFGWVSKVSEIINQKPQKVNSWMKRIMPEFYEERCFKKKINKKTLEF
jgi:very-short-patch-repair endonuclease